MAMPDKSIEIDLDALGLDDWVLFEELKASGSRSVKAMRDLLVVFLGTAGWTAAEVGRLNLGEMKQVMTAITERSRGPNLTSGSPSTQPTATAGRFPSAPASRVRRKSGAVPRGKLRPSSA